MKRRLFIFFLALSLFPSVMMSLAGCREEDRPRPALTTADNELLRSKADEKIGIIIRENLPALFAGVVVFGSNAFITQSAMLDQANLSVLNMFGNTAILLVNSRDIPLLLNNQDVKKIFYLCRQGALARLDDALEMDMMRRFGDGRENEPVAFLARFREPPGGKEVHFLEAAGFVVQSRQGAAWTISGPPARISRLMEDDRITFYESALSQPGTPVKKEVPKASESLEDIKARELKEPPERKDRAIPSHRINRDGIKPVPPASNADNNAK